MFKKFLPIILLALSVSCLHAQNFAYVPNNNGTLSVINVSTNTVVATIPGFDHPFCATASPDGQLVYVCNEDNSVVAVSTATNSVITHIPLPGALGFIGNEGAGPVVSFNADGTRAFALATGGGVNSTVYVINTASNTVVNSASFGTTFLLAVAISPDGRTLYVATQGNPIAQSAILVLDANTLATITTIAPGHIIFDLAISMDGSTLYASDVSGLIGGQSGVLVIDTASNTVTATVSLPNNSFVTGIAVTPDGQHVYVENFTLTRPANSTVTVINTADDSVNTTIPANGDTLTALAITPDGSTVLAVNSVLSTTVNSSVLVIPTATNAIANSVTVGFFPISIATTTLGTDIVKCPTVITQPGTYKVANDLHCFNTNGIDIRADNVTLMLGGHTITQDAAHFGFAGRGVNAGVGLATGNSNVQIFGPGTITGFNRGVDFEQVSNSLVKNVTTTGNFFGFAVNGGFSAGCGASCPSTGNLFRGNISTLNNQHGFTMNGATNNVFNANDASSNGAHGFLLFVASGNNVQGNTFNNNGQSGIIIASGTGTGNNLHQNTAQNNGIVDLEDDNPNCGSNTWNQNIFGTASQPCIQ